MRTSIARALGVCLAVCTLTSNMVAGVVRLNSEPPTDSPLITFSETNSSGKLINYLKPDPVYSFSNVKDLGDVTVRFGSLFNGQSLGMMDNSLDDTTPTGPLSLNMSGPTVGVVLENWAADKLVLGGMNMTTFQMFTTPIAIAFDKPVAWVSFDAGKFDHADTTYVEAFGGNGNSLGRWTNSHASGGVENFYLSETTEAQTIAGISIYVPKMGMDWEGFAVDNIRFGGLPEDPDGEQVPEPSSALLMVAGLLGACGQLRGRGRRLPA